MIGVVILAHEHLNRTRLLAKAIASKRVKVVIHVDANTDDKAVAVLKSDLAKNQNIDFCERTPCAWGQFSLVRAGMVAAEELTNRWSEITHVVQISGSCLPVRPIGELSEFLERNRYKDFVESVSLEEGDWVVDGLAAERFSLYFPFSWQRQRKLFDLSVEFQRKLGISRRIPEGLSPHLGSQWWCLSRETLLSILSDPKRGQYDQYFSKCWIPDESYIPTLARKHSSDLVSRSLTLSRFDDQGKPHLFYDDHGDMLEQTDRFFARKIWHGADGLYRRFAKRRYKKKQRGFEAEFGLNILFEGARERRCKGRIGRLNVGRFPSTAHDPQPQTCRKYGVFVGFSHLFEGFEPWLRRTTGTVAHRRLFKRNAVQFADHAEQEKGGLTTNPLIRDYNPEQFLCNLLWNGRDSHQSMMLEISDENRIATFSAKDQNAQLYVLRGGWILDLMSQKSSDTTTLKRRALRLAEAEKTFLEELRDAGRDDVQFISLLDIVKNTKRELVNIQNSLRPEVDLRPEANLRFSDISELRSFVAKLAELGVPIDQLGPLPRYLPGEIDERRNVGREATA